MDSLCELMRQNEAAFLESLEAIISQNGSTQQSCIAQLRALNLPDDFWMYVFKVCGSGHRVEPTSGQRLSGEAECVAIHQIIGMQQLSSLCRAVACLWACLGHCRVMGREEARSFAAFSQLDMFHSSPSEPWLCIWACQETQLDMGPSLKPSLSALISLAGSALF